MCPLRTTACQLCVDVREFCPPRPGEKHALAGAHETQLRLHPQRRRVVRERSRIDGLSRARGKGPGDDATRCLRHVAPSPVGLAKPVSEVGAGGGLHVARLLHARADAADEAAIERDREVGLRRRRRHTRLDEFDGVCERIGPGRHTEPAHHLPVVEQRQQRLSVGQLQRSQQQPLGADDLVHGKPHVPPNRLSQLRQRTVCRALWDPAAGSPIWARCRSSQ